MNNAKTVSSTELTRNVSSVLEDAERGITTTVIRHSRPVAVISPVDDGRRIFAVTATAAIMQRNVAVTTGRGTSVMSVPSPGCIEGVKLEVGDDGQLQLGPGSVILSRAGFIIGAADDVRDEDLGECVSLPPEDDAPSPRRRSRHQDKIRDES